MPKFDGRDVAILVGRLMLAALFLLEGAFKASHYGGAVAYMEAAGVPGFLLPAVIALELGGGALVALGLRVRPFAVLFALFCITAALVFHGNIAVRGELLHLEKDVAIAGGFLLLAAFGPGRLALDAVWRPAKF